MKTKTILLLTLVFCIAARLAVSLPLDNSYPAGTDTSIHIFRGWLFEKFGLVKWNYYTEGGLPLLNIYPPLAYIFTGLAGKIFGFLLSYKIVNNFFFIAAPIIFFFLLKELGLDEKKTAIALLFFSLTPVYAYYNADGRFTSSVAFTFSLAAWLFLKKSFDGKRFSYIFLSASSLAASILTSQIIGFMSLPILFFWLIFEKFSLPNLKKITAVYFLAFLFSAWWVMPFMLDGFKADSSSSLLTKKINIFNFKDEILARIGLLGVYVSDWAVAAVFAFLGITALLCLVSLLEIKNKTNRTFILVAAMIVVVSLISAFKRIFIFLPIPVSIIAAYGLEKLKGGYKILLLSILAATLMSSFFLIQPKSIYNPTFPQLPTDGRFIFFGNETKYYGRNVVYNLYYLLSGVQGNENIQGWYVSDQATFGSSGFYSTKKLSYGRQLMNFSVGNEENYYKIMNGGWVNYFIFDTGNKTFEKFFSGSMFRTYSADERFTIIEIVPKAKYVEVNGKGVEANFEKGIDMITINMSCSPGIVTVKERFDRNWRISLSGKNVAAAENEYGFMDFISSQSGPCKIVMKYEYDNYYNIFLAVSSLSLAAAVAYFLYDLRRKKN